MNNEPRKNNQLFRVSRDLHPYKKFMKRHPQLVEYFVDRQTENKSQTKTQPVSQKVMQFDFRYYHSAMIGRK